MQGTRAPEEHLDTPTDLANGRSGEATSSLAEEATFWWRILKTKGIRGMENNPVIFSDKAIWPWLELDEHNLTFSYLKPGTEYTICINGTIQGCNGAY